MVPASQTTFLAERYWPGVTRADVETAEQRLRSAADEITREGAPVRATSLIWVPTDEVALTLFEADEKDDVLAVSRRSGCPFDRLQRVEIVTGAIRR